MQQQRQVRRRRRHKKNCRALSSFVGYVEVAQHCTFSHPKSRGDVENGSFTFIANVTLNENFHKARDDLAIRIYQGRRKSSGHVSNGDFLYQTVIFLSGCKAGKLSSASKTVPDW